MDKNMQDKEKSPKASVWQKVQNPPAWVKAIVFSVTLLSCIFAVWILFVDYQGTILEIVAYALFGLAGLSLTYTIILIIPLFPKIKEKIERAIESNSFTKKLSQDFGYKTVVFAIVSFIISILYAGFNGYMGIVGSSVWYGSLAAYYVLLVLIRGGVLLSAKTSSKDNGLPEELKENKKTLDKAKAYRNGGIALLVLNVALSVAIVQMIFDGAHFSYAGWTIFAHAGYAFFKMTRAIINLVKASKHNDYSVKAVRNINVIDGAVSILALQTAMLTTFNQGMLDISFMNTITGIAVSLCSVVIGVVMIVKGAKQIKNLKEKKKNG